MISKISYLLYNSRQRLDTQMQIEFRNVRGTKCVSFRDNKGHYICALRKCRFQPQYGWKLEQIDDVVHHENGTLMSYTYKTIKTFDQSNAGMDYVYSNFDQLNQQYQDRTKLTK